MRHASQTVRRTRLKGFWMQLRNPEVLTKYMESARFNQSQLARSAGCSRQFINKLVNGQSRTCTKELAIRIEKSLSVLPATIFVPRKSTTDRRHVNRKGTAA